MPYGTFPTSPVPADMTREALWGAAVQQYDSGVEQASTAFVKPLMKYSITLSNLPRSKQSSLHAFWNACKGQVTPFLFKDPYDFRANGTICVRTGTAARSFFIRTAEGYPVIAASGTIRITSTLSGTLTQGTHYSFDQDTGVFSTHITPSSSDFWVASCEYFRKCKFDSYQENSKLWNSFGGSISFHEIALP